MSIEKELLSKLSDASSNLAQYASYAEIVGAISVNRSAIRQYCDKVFEINREIRDLLDAFDEEFVDN